MENLKIENLEAAEEKYLEGVNIIRELCTIQKGSLDPEKYQTALCQFETVLQGVLLYVSLLDGKLQDEERQFMTEITIFGDVLIPVNDTGRRRLYSKWVPVTWDNFNDSPVPSEKMQAIIKETLDFEVRSFIEPFSVIDRDISSTNYVERLRSFVPEIIRAVCFAGEESHNDEKMEESVRKGIEVFELTFCLQWEHFKNKRQANYASAEAY